MPCRPAGGNGLAAERQLPGTQPGWGGREVPSVPAGTAFPEHRWREGLPASPARPAPL